MSKYEKSGMETTINNVYVPPALAMILNKPQVPREYPTRASNYVLRLRGTRGFGRGTTKPRRNA